jgi:hypothetical protein
VKTIQHAYNLPMKFAGLLLAALVGSALCCCGQQLSPPTSISITTKKLPKASLWNRYSFQLQAAGGSTPYHWRVVEGSLPRGIRLQDDGTLEGELEQQTQTDFTLTAIDRMGKHQFRKFALATETPLMTEWSHKAQVNGLRIDGSIKVSNTTGRDFDLTFVVLAVNDIGRATAIGYQHFSLKQNTKDMEIPFGDTLSFGNYVVNVDVVGEESQSNMIFRSRLVSEKEVIAQGP